MQLDRNTKIGERNIPIGPGNPITVHFGGGRGGKEEAGAWEFWTVFNDDYGCTARCRQGSDPGERFRRMESLEAYRRHWEVAATATGIRPATANEVLDWLNDHPEDAGFADVCQIGFDTLAVVRTGEGFRFV